MGAERYSWLKRGFEGIGVQRGVDGSGGVGRDGEGCVWRCAGVVVAVTTEFR